MWACLALWTEERSPNYALQCTQSSDSNFILYIDCVVMVKYQGQ